MQINPRHSTAGFVSLAALLVLLLLSAVAISAIFTVNSETDVSHDDLENTLAYYGAEGGMEKMMSDLNFLYSSQQAPSVATIQGLGAVANQPVLPLISYPEYTFTVPNVAGVPTATVRNISSGSNEGLVAFIIPMTLDVTARRPSGAETEMIRNIEVAQIPVFQFGIFSDSDLSYFPGPSFDFGGRVHTNGNLFLSSQNNAAGPNGLTGLSFHSKIKAVGEVIRAEMANGINTTTDNRTQPINIPRVPNGCDPVNPPVANCRDLQENEGSKVAGPTSANNAAWVNLSTTTYNSMITNGLTGARPLTLPFVAPTLRNIEIIRRPPAGEDPTALVAESRLYSQAQIRVLLADTQNGLCPNPAPPNDPTCVVGDLDNIQLVNATNASPGNYGEFGIPVAGIGDGGNTYFATAQSTGGTALAGQDSQADWVRPPGVAVNTNWYLVGGWLRVEYRNAAGNFVGVTRQWLQYGFARGRNNGGAANNVDKFSFPDQEHGIVDTVNTGHPNAILIFQVAADRDNDGALTSAAPKREMDGTAGFRPDGAASRYKYYPINMYDTREGEIRDISLGSGAADSTCAIGGIMNVVELNVGNLARWLTGAPPYNALGGSGALVENATQNGYILYFSDRRGMLNAPAPVNAPIGEYGYEDNVNPGTAAGLPNGVLDNPYGDLTKAPEDVNQDQTLEVYGRADLGDGFIPGAQGGDINANPGDRMDSRVNCLTNARKNRVTGARHAIMIENGSTANGVNGLPVPGFTVGSENPVYVVGNYNAQDAPTGYAPVHAAAAVIADSVTVLSKNWRDIKSFVNPTYVDTTAPSTVRLAQTTYYRMAVAGGKNRNWPYPIAWAPGAPNTIGNYGLDGGVHNFLRYLESWSGQTLNYQGSLVSLYFSEQGVGIFKCCSTVYQPPTRNYQFDALFLNPANLPPGTPRFRDIVNLGYRQVFNPE